MEIVDGFDERLPGCRGEHAAGPADDNTTKLARVWFRRLRDEPAPSDLAFLAQAFERLLALTTRNVREFVTCIKSNPDSDRLVNAVLQGVPRFWAEYPALREPSSRLVAELLRQMPRPLPDGLRSLIMSPSPLNEKPGKEVLSEYEALARILLAAAASHPSSKAVLREIISSERLRHAALRAHMAEIIWHRKVGVVDPSLDVVAHAVLFAEWSRGDGALGLIPMEALLGYRNAVRADIKWRGSANSWPVKALLWLKAKLQTAHLPSGLGWHNIVDVDLRRGVRKGVEVWEVTVTNSDGRCYEKCWRMDGLRCPKPANRLGRTYLDAKWKKVSEKP